MFIENILALYEPLYIIILNRGSQFISNFWKKFYKIFKMDRKLLIVYYLQIDRLIKKINFIIKIYLRAFID